MMNNLNIDKNYYYYHHNWSLECLSIKLYCMLVLDFSNFLLRNFSVATTIIFVLAFSLHMNVYTTLN